MKIFILNQAIEKLWIMYCLPFKSFPKLNIENYI